jgi:CAAX protease family protein
MHEESFSYLIFWNNPFSTLCLFTLVMSFISLWIYRTFWLWGVFLLLFSIMGYQAGLISLVAYIPIVLLGLIYFELKNQPSGGKRIIWVGIVIAISVLLWFHVLPGFYHWKLGENIILSKEAIPLTYRVDFDIPFIGIYALGWIVPLVRRKEEIAAFFKHGLPLAMIGALAVILFVVYIGIFKWDPKFNKIFFAHYFISLFLIVIPEEGFLRGFVQQEIDRWLGGGIWGGIGAVLISALFSSLLYLAFTTNFSFLCFSFAAALVYGIVYQATKMIECSIVCHALVYFCHLVFLTYPFIA